MAKLKLSPFGKFKSKPVGPAGSGTAAVYALGDKILASKGVNKNLVRAMKRALEDERRAKAKMQAGVAA